MLKKKSETIKVEGKYDKKTREEGILGKKKKNLRYL